jgi:hypothetical protein
MQDISDPVWLTACATREERWYAAPKPVRMKELTVIQWAFVLGPILLMVFARLLWLFGHAG